MIHGSSLSVSDELTPSIDPIYAIDRLSRMDLNQLFCGRSGLAFEYQIESGSLNSQVQTLDNLIAPTPTILSNCMITGVVLVARVEGKASYTLYHPERNKLIFKPFGMELKKASVKDDTYQLKIAILSANSSKCIYLVTIHEKIIIEVFNIYP